jgi:DNA-binding NarL/FixJ family response regulator
MDQIRVVLAEDNLIAREGISRLLDAAPDIVVVDTCSDADALRESIEKTSPDVVLTDIRMPPTGTDEGIRIASELRGTHPDVGVVVLSMHAQPEYAIALLEGSSDRRAYLLKDRLGDSGELYRAIREVAAGGSVIDARVVDQLLGARAAREDSKLATLTAREREILALIAEGKSNQAIAEQVVITKRSVERHINQVFWKLDLSDSADYSRRVKATLLYLAHYG